MPAVKPLPAVQSDKALARQVDGIQEDIDDVAASVDLMSDAAERASLKTVFAELRKRLRSLRDEVDAKAAAKFVAVLAKDAKKACDAGNRACIVDAMRGSWTAMRDELSGKLAEAMVEVGRIEPLVLRAPLQKEQVALRAEMDKALQSKALDKALDAFRALLGRIDALLARVRDAHATGASLRSGYLPLLARLRVQIQRVPAERCRKTLLAEIEFVEADVQKALGKGETKIVKTTAVPQLQRLERLAVRIVAVSPALDRELTRIAQRLQGRPDASELLKRLKALIQAKGGDWPAGAGADDIERSLARFEIDVGKLAALADKLPAAAAAGR